jgi:hypothetical protein
MAWHILTVLGDALWRTEAGVELPGGGYAYSGEAPIARTSRTASWGYGRPIYLGAPFEGRFGPGRQSCAAWMMVLQIGHSVRVTEEIGNGPTRRPRRPYRLGLGSWFAYGIAAFLVVGAALLSVAGVFGNDSNIAGDDPTTAGDRVAALVLAVALLGFGGLALQAAKFGVYVDDHDVTVRGHLRSERIPWSQVESFGTTSWRSELIQPIVRRLIGNITFGVGTPTLVINRVGGGSRVVRILNAKSALVWFGTKPVEIAQRLKAARPAPHR